MDRMSASRRRFLLRREREHPHARGVGAGLRRSGAVLRRRDPAASVQAAARSRATASGCGLPLHLGRPVWVDDPHFQILYHVRHTAVPRPGSDEQLRNLAGRVLGQRLDLAKPLWEVWLVEGLEDDRWAIISKVHHCMIDGVAGTDLMQLMFDSNPDAELARAEGLDAGAQPVELDLVADARARRRAHPGAAARLVPALGRGLREPSELDFSRSVLGSLPAPRQAAITPTARSLNGPIGPHRRWAWTRGEPRRDQARPHGDRRHGQRRRPHRDHPWLPRPAQEPWRAVVDGWSCARWCRCRCGAPDQRGNARTTGSRAVFVNLPVGESDPLGRLAVDPRADGRAQEQPRQARRRRSIIGLGDFAAPTLLSLGVADRRACRSSSGARRSRRTSPARACRSTCSAGGWWRCTPTCRIAGAIRISVGIFSYLDQITFGDQRRLRRLPRRRRPVRRHPRGIDELLAVATSRRGGEQAGDGEAAARPEAEPRAGRRPRRRHRAKTTTAAAAR